MKDTVLTFKRYEKKYLLSAEKYSQLMERLEQYIIPDRFHKSTVCSIYYDTENFELIRHSIEKPVYKEKLRLRSYNVPGPEGEVFVELKKKFKGIVYKRRVRMTAAQASAYLSGECAAPMDTQTTRELDWVLKSHALSPKVFIACDRFAYVAKDDENLRITFDKDLRWRETELDLTMGCHGKPVLKDGQVLMEIKIPGAAPIWLAHLLSELEIYPQSFSKYGSCYKNELLDKYINGVIFSA